MPKLKAGICADNRPLHEITQKVALPYSVPSPFGIVQNHYRNASPIAKSASTLLATARPAVALARPDAPVLPFIPQTAKTRHSATQVPDVAPVLSFPFLASLSWERRLYKVAAEAKGSPTHMSARTAPLKPGEQTVEIKLAHSPDSDDAFMFYALATHKLPTPGYKYTHVLSDIQTLNEAALTETYDVTAVSFAAYPSIRDKYILVDCGASFGEGLRPYRRRRQIHEERRHQGPAHRRSRPENYGLSVSQTYEPNFEAVVMPFDKILDAVQDELVDAGC